LKEIKPLAEPEFGRPGVMQAVFDWEDLPDRVWSPWGKFHS
jgi:hypothetical protein